jgi:hypothetical protein
MPLWRRGIRGGGDCGGVGDGVLGVGDEGRRGNGRGKGESI